jgi:hypothetical protein
VVLQSFYEEQGTPLDPNQSVPADSYTTLRETIKVRRGQRCVVFRHTALL